MLPPGIHCICHSYKTNEDFPHRHWLRIADLPAPFRMKLRKASPISASARCWRDAQDENGYPSAAADSKSRRKGLKGGGSALRAERDWVDFGCLRSDVERRAEGSPLHQHSELGHSGANSHRWSDA